MRSRTNEHWKHSERVACGWILIAIAWLGTGCTTKYEIQDPVEAFIWLKPGDELVIYEKDGSTTELVVSAVNLAEVRGDASRIDGISIASRPVAISLSEIASIDRVEEMMSPENTGQLIGGVGVHMIFLMIGGLIIALML